MKINYLNLLVFFLSFNLSAQNNFQLEWANEKVLMKNLNNNKVLDFQFDDFEKYDWIATVKKDKKQGLVNLVDGNVYCCDYDEVTDVKIIENSAGVRAFIKKGTKKGVIGFKNSKASFEILLAPEYDDINNSEFESNLIFTRKKNDYQLYNLSTKRFVIADKVKYPLTLYPVENENSLYEIRTESWTALYNYSNDKILVQPIAGSFNFSSTYESLYLFIQNGGKETYVDTITGKPVLNSDYCFGFKLSKRYVSFSYKKKYGVYDLKQKQIVVKPIYATEDDLLNLETKYTLD
jgi:hypothetical protein